MVYHFDEKRIIVSQTVYTQKSENEMRTRAPQPANGPAPWERATPPFQSFGIRAFPAFDN